jgi:hypothetical protein
MPSAARCEKRRLPCTVLAMDFDVKRELDFGLAVISIMRWQLVVSLEEAEAFENELKRIARCWTAPTTAQVWLALYRTTGRNPRGERG